MGQAVNSLVNGQVRMSKRTVPSVYRKMDDQEILGAPHGKEYNKKVKEMKCLFWNCRGVRKKGIATYVRDLMGEYRFDFVCF
jgi:hypothetical protein